MVDLQQAGGTTWNEAADISTRYPELTTANPEVIPVTTVSQIVTGVQNMIKAMLRPHWDVDDDDYFSSTNIDTYAPVVKEIHLRWSAGECYEAIVGRNSVGTVRSAEYGAILIDQARQMIVDLIANGSLEVARRTSSPDGARAYTTASLATPMGNLGDETTQPYTPSSGDRDTDPWQ